MGVDREDLTRLHFINALFSRVTGSDLYLAEQIKSAIAFSLAELEQQTAEHPERADQFDAAFNEAAVRLLSRLFEQMPSHGFYHWDAAQTSTASTPLFARSEIMKGLKSLARFREATLLITNLRPAILPANRRASPKRQREYEEALALVRDLAAARTAASANLHLLFL
jgi:hypothetical protein